MAVCEKKKKKNRAQEIGNGSDIRNLNLDKNQI